ncbi:hypothetical protein C0Z19_16100 [Trinickia soli]|uniref:Uncharacterized protein n=1 Tax=Trinickia soli TaxID=380675 RepID=A0A2N7W0B5_9BURK|nr:hypothetical protein CIW54_05425 [Paraburkholderia sp. T12-10]PMS22811.1 hypothetical protein C0Z19_16100 [Trinickia soli]
MVAFLLREPRCPVVPPPPPGPYAGLADERAVFSKHPAPRAKKRFDYGTWMTDRNPGNRR